MKTLVLFLSLMVFMSLKANETYPEQSDWEVVLKIKDSTLKPNRTRINFKISGLDLNDGKQQLVWSANKYIDTTFINHSSSRISKVFISGNYKFMFYANSQYREIIIPKLKLNSGYALTVELNFKTTERNIMVKKPVIYLYPEERTVVHLKVKPAGDMTFTYPEHGDNGWQVTAEPNGELSVNGKMLNYLFWESEQAFSKTDFEIATGTIVPKTQTVDFLSETLTHIGLNSKEQADFITFWGPQLQKHDQSLIQFIFNDEADKFGELQIRPAPDSIIRVYILISDATGISDSNIVPQKFPHFERSGFTVVEWGGSNLTEISM